MTRHAREETTRAIQCVKTEGERKCGIAAFVFPARATADFTLISTTHSCGSDLSIEHVSLLPKYISDLA